MSSMRSSWRWRSPSIARAGSGSKRPLVIDSEYIEGSLQKRGANGTRNAPASRSSGLQQLLHHGIPAGRKIRAAVATTAQRQQASMSQAVGQLSQLPGLQRMAGSTELQVG